MDAQFLEHYNRELAYLRELGGEFAQQYPAVAGRLGIETTPCADPFVERLLEGVAFLAARVHRRLDSEFPEFTLSLLETLYPHFARPLPACGLVRLQPDRDEGSLADGYHLPRGTTLLGPTTRQQSTACRFDTCEDVDLWPLRIESVDLVSREAADDRPLPAPADSAGCRSCLRITLGTTAGLPVQALAMQDLRLHLVGEGVAYRLYELLGAHARWAFVRGVDEPAGIQDVEWHALDISRITEENFQPQRSLFPEESRSFSGYRLLQEYFALPEKLLACTIGGFQPALRKCSGKQVEIVIGVDAVDSKLTGRVREKHLALHCVPVANLYRRRADRVRLTPEKAEHHLLVDRSRPLDFEVWSIDSLTGHGEGPREQYELLPLYAPPERRPGTRTNSHGSECYYYTHSRRSRQPSMNQRQYGHRSDYLGSEVFLTLTPPQGSSGTGDLRQISGTVYCTNRDLALVEPEGGWRDALGLAGAGPVERVEFLVGPTRPRPSLTNERGRRVWQLVHHLGPDHLMFGAGTEGQSDGKGSAAMLRDLLSLYCQRDLPSQAKQVEGILRLKTRCVTRRLPLPGPLVHGRGTEVSVCVDEDAFAGGSGYLLGTVLDQFFARLANLNSFTETTLWSEERGEVARWPVRLGKIAPL